MHVEETTAWVLRLQGGDETAFDEIYAAYAKGAVRTACLITGDLFLAQDIAQESFVLCMLNIGKLKNPQHFRAWFYRILTRCSWQMLRKKGRMEALDDAACKSLPSAGEIYPSEHRARYESLYRALEQLGTKQRTAVILFYFNDLSIREIAQACSIPEASVKTRLFAARRRLKQILTEEAKHAAEP